MIIKNVLFIDSLLVEEVFHFRSSGLGWQEHQEKIQSQQLSKHYPS